MAVPPYRRKPKKLNELPGLWDGLPEEPEQNEVNDIILEYRKKQFSPTRPLKAEQIDHQMLRNTVRPNELEFISFGSGSSGNCAYIGIRGKGGVLIDAGIDTDKVIKALEDNYIPIEKISGIIVTHDHSDHVRFAYKMLRKNPKMLLYCTQRCINGILRRHSISKRIKDYQKPIFKEFEFEAGPLKITPFEVNHDGTDNVGFSIEAGEKRFVIATDMGKIGERADYYIRQANYLMIESNYDNHMLEAGRYPEYLKARIRSERGHLCNEVTAQYIGAIWTPAMTNIYLCHLSEDNNTPEIALRQSHDALTTRRISVGDASGSSEALAAQVQLTALARYDVSPLYIHRI